MYVHGEFINKKGDVVAVHILTNGDRTEEMEIGTEESGLWFPAESPVVIEDEVNDTFDVLLRQSAKVTLLCRDYVPGFFCTSALSAVVNIYRGGECVFAGFLEPQTYSQPYNDVLDELELNCLDALSGLQYMNYKSVGALGVVYEIVRSEAGQRTFGEVVMEALRGVSDGLDILAQLEAPEEGDGEETPQDEEKGDNFYVWFDGSKSADKEGSEGTAVFSDLGVTDLLFMGDGADSVWKQSTVVEEVLKYLNLHIRQDGFDFYIFDWATVKGNGAEGATWYALNGDETWKDTARLVTLSADNVEGCDAEISIGEVYNQLLLTAVMETQENIVENPLDSEGLTSAYDGMQKYMTEYAVNISGLKKEWKPLPGTREWYYEWKEEEEKSTGYEDSYNAFSALVRGQDTNYKDAYVTDWYLRLKQHAHWKFPMGDWQPIEGKAPKSSEDLVTYAKRNGAGQDQVLNWLDGTTGRGCIAAFGSLKRCMADAGNSGSKPSMENRLVVSVGGSWVNAESKTPAADKQLAAYKAIVGEMKKNRPCAVYESVNAGGVFSPSDAAITNYIVLSGKITLNPVTPVYTHLADARQNMERHPVWNDDEKFLYAHPMPSSDEEYTDDMLGNREAVDDVSYKLYTQQYWHTVDPLQNPVENLTVTGLYPMTENCQTSFRYNPGAWGDWMVEYPVLTCMLIIGDKCVVETGVLGTSPSYEWREYKTREECDSDDEYYHQCFYISFNPRSGEYALGVEHDMMNNVTIQTGIDAEGIAIPMKESDHLAGIARFVIVGPTPLSSNFFKWDIYDDFDDSSFLFLGSPLMYTRSIELKDFDIKLYSDSGHYDDGEEKDVVYMSNTKEKFVNRKEDIEMKINSALTAAECRSLGVASVVKSSTPVNMKTHSGVLTIYDRCGDEEAKAEHLYVDRYWNEYHKPRILLEQCVRDDESTTRQLTHYKHQALKKEFYVQGYGRDLMEGTVTLKLKESGE